MSDNPYAAPAADVAVAPTGELAEAESIRTKHLSHEASIRGVGALYILVAIFSLIVGFAILMGMRTGVGNEEDLSSAGLVAGLVFLLLFAVAQLWTGFGLRRLKPSARIPGIVFGVLSLLNFPLGTLIGSYIIYLLVCAKGKLVLSDDYARIREQTPHLKYRTSVIVWILLALLLGLLVASVLIPAMR